MDAQPQIEDANVEAVQVPAEVLDAVKFGEDVKIDWRRHPLLHQKCWDMQKTEEE